MKYLLIIKPRSVPPPAALRAHKEWVLLQEKRGRFQMSHCFAAEVGGFTVANVNSLEELNDLHFEAPAGPYCDIEIHPLVDFALQMDRLADLLERSSRIEPAKEEK